MEWRALVLGIQVDNLSGLRARNHSLKVGVFAAFGPPLLAFGVALNFALLLLLLLLSS